MKKRLSLIFVFATAFTALGAPWEADDPLPKAETILDRYIEVTGGQAAYEKRKSEISTGTVEFAAQNLKGSFTRYAAEPDKSYAAMDLAGVGKIETGSNDGVAWENSALLGPRVKTGEEKSQALREGLFNAQLNWRKMFSKVETAGMETVDGEDCYKVILTPSEGRPETTYYQKKSGLAVRTNTIVVNQMGELPMEVSITDYKDFEGVRMPTKLIQKVAGQEFTMTIQSVKVNPEIPPDRFELPAEVKAVLNKPAAAAKKQ
jgi:hypothetical protein